MVEVKGLDALLKNFSDYITIRDEEYQTAATEAFSGLKSALEEYPPERPGSTYVRTFFLQLGWTEAEMMYAGDVEGFTASASNPTPYGLFVQGDPTDTPSQASMHAGLWTPEGEILSDNENEIVASFESANERITDRLGSI